MKTLLIIAAFLATCQATSIGRAVENKFQLLKCRNGTYGVSDDQAVAIQRDCGPSKYGTEPGAQHANCVFYCQSEIFGLLNSDGLPTLENYYSFVEHSVAAEHHELTRKWFRDCFEKYGQVDKSDPECKVAGELNVCTWSIQPQLVCKE